MKFGTLREQKMLFRMTLTSSNSEVAFQFKLKVKLRSINTLKFKLESNV